MKQSTCSDLPIVSPARPRFGRAGIAAGVAAAALAAGADAAVVTKWSFNTGSLNATTGTGAARAFRTTVLPFSAGAAADTSPGTNRALRVNGFDFTAATAGTRGVWFATDVSGYDGLRVTWHQRNDLASAQWARFQYSTNNGQSYTSAGLARGGLYKITLNNTFTRVSFDLSGIDGLTDNPQLRFRMVAMNAPGTGVITTTSGQAFRPSASWSIDGVTVTGTALFGNAHPAPGAVSLLGVAGLAGGRRRRGG